MAKLLHARTLVVLGHPYRNDVFSRSLFEAIRGEQCPLDVIWTFNDFGAVRHRNDELLEMLRPGIERMLVFLADGINAHCFLPDLWKALRTTKSVAPLPLFELGSPPSEQSLSSTASYTIYVRTLDSAVKAFAFTRATLVVGRECDGLVVSDDRMSRVHGKFSFDGTTLSYRDLGSTNGTYDEGGRITHVAMYVGSQVRLGDTLIFVSAINRICDREEQLRSAEARVWAELDSRHGAVRMAHGITFGGVVPARRPEVVSTRVGDPQNWQEASFPSESPDTPEPKATTERAQAVLENAIPPAASLALESEAGGEGRKMGGEGGN